MYNQVCYAFFDAFNPENLSGPIFEARLSWKSAQIHQNPLMYQEWQDPENVGF